jgi:heme-degrading monooxygenase HmoA
MWIRLGSFTVRPGQEAQLCATYNSQAVPRVRTSPGNLACLLLEPATATDGNFLACTVWATRADAEAYDSSGTAAQVVGLVRQYFAGPPVLTSYVSESRGGLSS